MAALGHDCLRRAAHAAGVDWYWQEVDGLRGPGGRLWNPLTQEGDARQLARQLAIEVVRPEDDADERVGARHPRTGVYWEAVSGDPAAATRRAIVRVAVHLGERRSGASARLPHLGGNLRGMA
jgi:hypothetical protein